MGRLFDDRLLHFRGRDAVSPHESKGPAIGVAFASATSLALWLGLAQFARWAAQSMF